MGVILKRREVSPGVFKTYYDVVAEAINRYTGKRVQKKRRNIPSQPKAERIYRELWSACKEERPDGVNFTQWGTLVDKYIESVSSKVRSEGNPHGFSPNVVRAKRSQLNHTQKWMETHIDLVTPQFVTDRLDDLERGGMSRMMTNQVLQQVKCVFGYALALGAVKANPFSGMKTRKMPKRRKMALTHEEVKLLLSAAKLRSHPYYEIWLLTISLGLRRSELAGLKWTDIDFGHGLIYLQRQVIPGEGLVEFLKSREERVVSIPEYLVSDLKKMKLKASSDFVIEVNCNRWKIGHQAQVLREFCRDIGIKEVTHHALRATHITLALIDGVPLGIVKANVGHAKLSTTDVYFRSAGITMKGQMNGLRVQIPASEEGVVVPLKSVR